ncbi:ribosomal-protein-alanine acetyltransferase [Luminiphilus syltensis NOR5-1B]|uniref:Ribosomal-protein-alanine acetyltransferase n=1 Tax=Luminiphilus syltensis NOR5-1B TaxID=565045 RepID=B8KQE1_9GAMM|nr:ribosomal-protein-alanine acetyltransferase [Luminiphilus syltensis NOR5-1B]
MPQAAIRRCRLDQDFAGINVLSAEGDGPSASFLQQLYDSGACHSWVVCDDGDDLVAMIWVTLVLEEADVVDLRVAERLRGRGIGKQLLAASLQALRRLGMERCLLEVRESNRAARHLYAGLGFVETGRRRDYYPLAGGREDAILMAFTLEATDSSPG